MTLETTRAIPLTTGMTAGVIARAELSAAPATATTATTKTTKTS